MDLKRVVSFEEDQSYNKYYVTISWYEDPMYLYETQTVVYTIDKSGEGAYRILSATDSKPETETPNENQSAENESSDAEGETSVENENSNGSNPEDEGSSENSEDH
ncbi:MAG: hypothetical protein IJE40_01445, partial [Clostridia bacterium]|nr:hypothetical protein [Clostridia bacterium]